MRLFESFSKYYYIPRRILFMARRKVSMDGNTAAAHASYVFTEVAAIYPITLPLLWQR